MRGDSYYDISPNSVANISVNGYPSVVADEGPALYFNGTSHSITVSGLDFNSILSNDYTIEFEAMQVSRIQSYPTPFSIVNGDGAYETQRSIYSHWKTNTVISLYDSKNVEHQYTSGALNKWFHIAVVREGNVLRSYINGTLVYTLSDANTLYTNANRLYIAGLSNSITGTLFNGYVRNIMISNKVKYTSTFTPTHEQYTSVSIDNARIEDGKLLFTVSKLSSYETISGIDILINENVVQTYNSTGSYEYPLDSVEANIENNIEIRVKLNSKITISESLSYFVKSNIEFVYKDEPTISTNMISYLRGDSYTDLALNASGRTANNFSTTLNSTEYGIEFGTGSGYLTMTNGASGLDWSGNFTIEWKEYSTGTGERNTGFFLNRCNDGSNNAGILLSYANGTQLYTGNSTSWNGFVGTIVKDKPLNTWVHWRLVRNGTTWTMYKNGVQYWINTNSVSPNTGTIDYGYSLGAWYDASGTHAGYAAIVRDFALFNTALNTTNFTPSDRPYTSVEISKVVEIDGKLKPTIVKGNTLESVHKIEYYMDGILVKTVTNDVENSYYELGNMPYGVREFEIRAYYYRDYYVKYILNYKNNTIGKLDTNTSFEEINEKLVELKNVYATLSDRLYYILTSKNVTIADDERKLSLLIEKVNELD
jgi:hypothetical protein